MREPIIFTCCLCDTSLNTNTSSEEKAGQLAARAGWSLGLPGQRSWCRMCSTVVNVKINQAKDAIIHEALRGSI